MEEKSAYPCLGTAMQQQDLGVTTEDRPSFSRIADYADELDRIASYLQDFIDRCRGGGANANGTGPTPVPSGHIGQLDRLADNLHRVDCLARELQRIG